MRVRREGEGMKAWKLEDNKTEKKCFIFVRVLRSFFNSGKIKKETKCFSMFHIHQTRKT